MAIKKITLVFILLSCFVFTINAQDTNKNICSELKQAKMLLSNNEILVTGEVFKPQIIKLRKIPVPFSYAIAMVGGLSEDSFIEETQIIRCSPDFDSIEKITFVNFQKIKNGKQEDLEVKAGEIIYVPKMKKSILNLKLISSS